MTVDNYVPYFDDVSDPKTFASNSNLTPGTNGEFMRFVFIGDIVAVNDEPVKGTWSATTTVLFLTPTPTPKQAIADSTRQNILEMFFDLQQADGNPIGTLMASGLTRGLPAPGAPKLQTEDSMAIIGGTGAFLGMRGQVGIINRGSPRVASMVEDPANRRNNGGAKRSYVFHLIPMTTPEILMTRAGPAIAHSADGTAVTAAKPAKAGEILTLYATGLGPTRPGVDPDAPFPADPPQAANSPIKVIVNGAPGPVLYAGGYPGTTNGYQVNFRLPDSVASGMATISLSAAWIAGSQVKIPIQ
jgi:uncharacterized protein (TIGR03437 family)